MQARASGAFVGRVRELEELGRALDGEIYDKIAFAAVGKYTEFESLRQAGVRYADVRGYSYDREDVTARGLASVYAQSLGAVFTAEQKPFEVELAVAEVGSSPDEDHLYRLTFDGSIADENGQVGSGTADVMDDLMFTHRQRDGLYFAFVSIVSIAFLHDARLFLD